MGIKCNIPKEFCNVRNPDGTCAINQICEPVVEQCEGCSKVENGYCKIYIRPSVKWRFGRTCSSATHIKTEAEIQREKRRVGQQKQRRRH